MLLGSGSGLGSSLGDLLHLGELCLLSLFGDDLFLLAFLDFLGSGFSVLVAHVTGLGLSALDFLKGHTNDGSLHAGGLACALLDVVVDLGLLVECAPRERPGQLNWLNFLVEKRPCLVANEVVESAISSNETASAAWVDFEFSERTLISLGDHFQSSICIK